MRSADGPPPPPPATWVVTSNDAWVAASTRLQIPVPCASPSRYLSVEFAVLSGTCIDFDVMHEATDETATRLYGPSRRAKSVRTCVPIPSEGVAYVTFDNVSSWLTAVQVRYTFRLTREEPADATTSAEMRFNRRVAADEASAAAQAEREAGADDVALGLADVPQQQLRIAAGALEQIELDGVAGAQLTASFEVVRGRDVDFGIMLVRPSRDGDGHAAAEEAIRLFGPCRRATGLATTVLVPEAGRVVLTFDNSGMWISSKTVSYRVRMDRDGVML